MQEARTIHAAITAALFYIPNLTAHSFLDKGSHTVACDKLPSARVADITYLSVSSTLTPHLIDHRHHNTAAVSVTFQHLKPPNMPGHPLHPLETQQHPPKQMSTEQLVTNRVNAAEAFLSLSQPTLASATATSTAPNRQAARRPACWVIPPGVQSISHRTHHADSRQPTQRTNTSQSPRTLHWHPPSLPSSQSPPPSPSPKRTASSAPELILSARCLVGPASFLNSQADYDNIFPNPVALTLKPCTISTTKSFLQMTNVFQALVHFAMLQTLTSNLRLLYVGTRRNNTLHSAVVQTTLRQQPLLPPLQTRTTSQLVPKHPV